VGSVLGCASWTVLLDALRQLTSASFSPARNNASTSASASILPSQRSNSTTTLSALGPRPPLFSLRGEGPGSSGIVGLSALSFPIEEGGGGLFDAAGENASQSASLAAAISALAAASAAAATDAALVDLLQACSGKSFTHIII
jgi:hypothetical protein